MRSAGRKLFGSREFSRTSTITRTNSANSTLAASEEHRPATSFAASAGKFQAKCYSNLLIYT